ncbi:hypothetical protein PILCRDRAFT_84226 [Piloderma croceum F 1598]|uniref:Uncharacterized protein n=1 Tax=Piloderma croceum (strain F 1598) TaxID=765440 RepID=A0A0C3BXG4_PILCF|nr:hypothetical protein PILCRDRAFT_84226 [Piloderma croceum F 1598]
MKKNEPTRQQEKTKATKINERVRTCRHAGSNKFPIKDSNNKNTSQDHSRKRNEVQGTNRKKIKKPANNRKAKHKPHPRKIQQTTPAPIKKTQKQQKTHNDNRGTKQTNDHQAKVETLKKKGQQENSKGHRGDRGNNPTKQRRQRPQKPSSQHSQQEKT